MARKNSEPVPFNAQPDSGRMGFRDPAVDGFDDGRPVIVWRQLWSSEQERLAYERAAREIQPDAHWRAPKDDEGKRDGQRTWLGMGRLCEEIAAMADGLTGGRLKEFPRRGMSNRQWAERAWEVKKAGGHAHYVEE